MLMSLAYRNIAGEQVDRKVSVAKVAAGLYSYFGSVSKEIINEDELTNDPSLTRIWM